MKVVATNTGGKRTVSWGFKKVTTGIFKYPNPEGIFLGVEHVVGDAVVDRKYHGGIDKACYAYSADQYPFWKPQFPDLEWDYGMFGENITIEGLDEKELFIGDTFKVGEAIIQVSEPRQPCMKLNVRFNSKRMVKAFMKHGCCGSYFRVLEQGIIKPGDTFELIDEGDPKISIFQVYQLIYSKGQNELRERALNHPKLADTTKTAL